MPRQATKYNQIHQNISPLLVAFASRCTPFTDKTRTFAVSELDPGGDAIRRGRLLTELRPER
jgi:hypothetical protein